MSNGQVGQTRKRFSLIFLPKTSMHHFPPQPKVCSFEYEWWRCESRECWPKLSILRWVKIQTNPNRRRVSCLLCAIYNIFRGGSHNCKSSLKNTMWHGMKEYTLYTTDPQVGKTCHNGPTSGKNPFFFWRHVAVYGSPRIDPFHNGQCLLHYIN